MMTSSNLLLIVFFVSLYAACHRLRSFMVNTFVLSPPEGYIVVPGRTGHGHMGAVDVLGITENLVTMASHLNKKPVSKTNKVMNSYIHVNHIFHGWKKRICLEDFSIVMISKYADHTFFHLIFHFLSVNCDF